MSAEEDTANPTATTHPEQHQQPTSTTPAAPQPAPATEAPNPAVPAESGLAAPVFSAGSGSSVSGNTEPAKPVPGTAPVPSDTQPDIGTEKAPEAKETAATVTALPPKDQNKEPEATVATGATIPGPTPVSTELDANVAQPATAPAVATDAGAAPITTPVPAPAPATAPVPASTATSATAPMQEATEPTTQPK